MKQQNMRILLTAKQIELIEMLLSQRQTERGKYGDDMLNMTAEDFQLLKDHILSTKKQKRVYKDWYLTDELYDKN